jgi:hypothetical protein
MLYQSRSLLQTEVSRQMTIFVIDGFKVIEVNHHHRQLAIFIFSLVYRSL